MNRLGCKWIFGVELFAHVLSAVGIYLGRFLRFNTWDIMTRPNALATSVVKDLAGKRPLLIIVVTSVVLASLYWIMKQLSLRIRQQKGSF